MHEKAKVKAIDERQKLFPKDLTLLDNTVKTVEDIVEMLQENVSESYKESLTKFKELTYDIIKG